MDIVRSELVELEKNVGQTKSFFDQENQINLDVIQKLVFFQLFPDFHASVLVSSLLMHLFRVPGRIISAETIRAFATRCRIVWSRSANRVSCLFKDFFILVVHFSEIAG